VKVGVLASGRGTNLQALIDRFASGSTDEGIEIVAVGSDQPDAPALRRARAAEIPVRVFERDDFPDRATRDAAMADWLAGRGAELIVLAGYMALLEPVFVSRFRDHIINVHPSLLPAFPGVRAIEQALEYGVQVYGVTVHLVDEGMDTGPILLQESVWMPEITDPSELHARLQVVEHELLPRAVLLMARGAVHRDPHNPRRLLSGT
jgi:phosphoribosylglycinamide formyltransferase-1